MYKLVALFALLACATAAPGYIASGLHAAPVVAAPVAIAHSVPVATSYANTYKVSVKSPLVATAPVAYTAPVIKAAPIVAAAPVVAHAPAVVAHAPIAYAAHAPIVALH